MGLKQTASSEYLGERISVNPNRYKDVFLLCHRVMEKLFASASIFSILVSGFHVLKPP